MDRAWKFSFGFFILCMSIGTSVNDENLKSELVIATPPQKYAAELFSEVALPCDVENNVGEETIVWMFNKITLFIDSHIIHLYLKSTYSVDGNHTLHIQNFTLDLAGTYTCAIPDRGISISHTVGLKDEVPKTIVIESGKDISLTLPCHPALQNSTEGLSVSEFEWVTDNDIPIVSNGSVSQCLKLNRFANIFYVENSSLILRRISYGNITLTCRITRFHTNYTYHLVVKSPETGYIEFHTPLEFNREGEIVILPCSKGDYIKFTTDSNYTWILKKNHQLSEVISLNQRILLRDNTAGFRIAENGSLVIPNFTRPSYPTHYECHSSNGGVISYFINTNQNPNVRNKDGAMEWITVRHDIKVERGNDVLLNCSIDEPDFVWIRNDSELLSISESLFKGNKSNNLKIHSGRSLVITDFSPPLNGIYECRSRTGRNYVYNVTEQRSTNQTIVVEEGETISLPCPTSSAQDGSRFAWIRDNVELLFINGRAVSVGRNDKLKMAKDERSLVIEDFSPSLRGVYVCHLITGINYTYNITSSKKSNNNTKRTMAIRYGTTGTTLHCPAKNNEENASFEWIFKNTNDAETVLFVNGVNFRQPWNNEYYVISENDGTSLVILVMDRFLYGVYICRWSTGEQYTYNIINGINWKNTTILANEGENVTLPCPIEDPRDRELNVIEWFLMLPKAYYVGEFQFIDGKKFPLLLESALPDYVKLADDKQSLIVSNITSNMEGDYICDLVLSSTSYRYLIKIKGPGP